MKKSFNIHQAKIKTSELTERMIWRILLILRNLPRSIERRLQHFKLIVGCSLRAIGIAAKLFRFHRFSFLFCFSIFRRRLKKKLLNPFVPTVPIFAVRETAFLGIMGAPRVPPLNPSETIVLSEHYRL